MATDVLRWWIWPHKKVVLGESCGWLVTLSSTDSTLHRRERRLFLV